MTAVLTPCQFGACGHCLAGRCDQCAGHAITVPEGYLTHRNGDIVGPVPLTVGPDHVWRCPCPHPGTAGTLFELGG